MRKIMDVLRLKEAGFSQRQIAESLACARSTVGDTLSRAAATTLTYEEAQELDEAALQARLYPGNSGSPRRRTEPDYEYLHRELRRPGVTLQRLWELCRGRHKPHSAPRVTRLRASSLCTCCQSGSRVSLAVSPRSR